MAERPLLILPTAEAISPPRGPRGGEIPITPARGIQANRIAPSLGAPESRAQPRARARA